MPCWTSARATAAPMPTEAPVTRATLPFHRSICLLLPVRTDQQRLSGSASVRSVRGSVQRSGLQSEGCGRLQKRAPSRRAADVMLELGSMNPGGEARLWSDSSLHITSHSGAVCGRTSPPAGHSWNSLLRLSVEHITTRDCDELVRLGSSSAARKGRAFYRKTSVISFIKNRNPGSEGLPSCPWRVC